MNDGEREGPSLETKTGPSLDTHMDQDSSGCANALGMDVADAAKTNWDHSRNQQIVVKRQLGIATQPLEVLRLAELLQECYPKATLKRTGLQCHSHGCKSSPKKQGELKWDCHLTAPSETRCARATDHNLSSRRRGESCGGMDLCNGPS